MDKLVSNPAPAKLLPKRDKAIMIRVTDQELGQIGAAALEAGATSVAGFSRDHLLRPTTATSAPNPVAEGIQVTRDEVIRLNSHLEQLTPKTFTEPHMDWAREAYGNVQALLEEINRDRLDALDRARADHERLSVLIERQQREVTTLLREIADCLTPAKTDLLLDR